MSKKRVAKPMNFKGTRGEWRPIFKHYKKEPKTICLGVGLQEKQDIGTYIEYVCNSVLPDTGKEYIKQRKQIEADMYLISAAPDMLEALQNIENDNGFIPAPIWEMIQNAIKKALNQ